MDKEEIIMRLKRLAMHSIHVVGELPYIMSLDDGIALDEAVRLLKEQPEIVRCKDCKHYMTIHCTCDGCCISDNWYCADGERKD